MSVQHKWSVRKFDGDWYVISPRDHGRLRFSSWGAAILWVQVLRESEQFRYSLSPAAFAHIQPSVKIERRAERGV